MIATAEPAATYTLAETMRLLDAAFDEAGIPVAPDSQWLPVWTAWCDALVTDLFISDQQAAFLMFSMVCAYRDGKAAQR